MVIHGFEIIDVMKLIKSLYNQILQFFNSAVLLQHLKWPQLIRLSAIKKEFRGPYSVDCLVNVPASFLFLQN